MMEPMPGVPMPDRSWGLCRSLTPQLTEYLEKQQLMVPAVDHVVVLKLDAKSSVLCYWSGERAIGYRVISHRQGTTIARLGAPESV